VPTSAFPPRPLPIVDLHGQYLRLKNEIDPAIQSVLDETGFINGKAVGRFASALSQYMGGVSVIPCGNGTDALQLAYMALNLKAGDEVIIPAFNYVAAAEAACLLGLTPVFAEAEAGSFNLDPQRVEEVRTGRTRAVVAVHLFGQACNLDVLEAYCSANGLFLIEDNAQAIGARVCGGRFDGKMAGTVGILGTTSFFPSKNLGGMGDGGAVFCRDPELADRVKMLANHGQKIRYQYDTIGINSRLDTLQAAVLEVKLGHLNDFIFRRQKAADYYDTAIGAADGIAIPFRFPGSTHVFHQYTLAFRDAKQRDRVREHLQAAGIQTMIYYPRALHLHPAYQGSRFPAGSFPVSENLGSRVLSLPMHTELTSEDLERIVSETLLASRG
jgi:UDP-2-acetamido-2-deoxy-ribo-hexuluronate aminotransferase